MIPTGSVRAHGQLSAMCVLSVHLGDITQEPRSLQISASHRELVLWGWTWGQRSQGMLWVRGLFSFLVGFWTLKEVLFSPDAF